MELTQILRNISRIVLAVAILAGVFVFTLQERGTKQKSLASTVSSNRENIAWRLMYAKELEQKGDTEQARKQILISLNFAPKDPYALASYGRLLSKSNDLGAQITKTKDIVARRPDYQQAWAKLALLYEYEGESGLANAARQKSEELARGL